MGLVGVRGKREKGHQGAKRSCAGSGLPPASLVRPAEATLCLCRAGGRTAPGQPANALGSLPLGLSLYPPQEVRVPSSLPHPTLYLVSGRKAALTLVPRDDGLGLPSDHAVQIQGLPFDHCGG